MKNSHGVHAGRINSFFSRSSFFWPISQQSHHLLTQRCSSHRQGTSFNKTCRWPQICPILRPKVVFMSRFQPELEECCVVTTGTSQLPLLFLAQFVASSSKLHAVVAHRRCSRNRSVLRHSVDKIGNTLGRILDRRHDGHNSNRLSGYSLGLDGENTSCESTSNYDSSSHQPSPRTVIIVRTSEKHASHIISMVPD